MARSVVISALLPATVLCASAPGEDGIKVSGFEVIGIGGPQNIIPMIRKAYPKLDLWGINASIGGNTLQDAVGRMERDVIRTDLGTEGIDWVVVMFGANDSGVMDAKTYESYYRKLIESVKRRTRAHVILVATPAFTKDGNWYRDRTKRIGEFLEVVRRLGHEYGLATVDLYNPSLAFAAKHGNETFAADGIHPTAEGHKMMARTFLKQFNFYGLEEIVEVNPAAGKVASTDGSDATLTATPGGSFTLKLVNRYDFPRQIGLKPAPAGRYDVYDENAVKLLGKGDSVVVEHRAICPSSASCIGTPPHRRRRGWIPMSSSSAKKNTRNCSGTCSCGGTMPWRCGAPTRKPAKRPDFRRFRDALRTDVHDRIVDMQGLLKSALVGRMPRGHRRIGPSFRREGARLFCGAAADRRHKRRHAVEENLDVVRYLTLPETGGLLKKMELVSANDTGPVHMAAAVGTPTLVVFAPPCDLRAEP